MVPRLALTAPTLRRILDYDRAVFRRFERRVRRLPKRGAFRDRGIGHGSLFATLLHTLHVRDAWFNFFVLRSPLGEDAFFGRPGRRPDDWRGFDAFATEVWAGHDRVRATLTDATARRPTHAFWMPGRYTVGDAILQVSYEQAHHLGEIIGALWIEDRASPDMTWIEVNRDELGLLGRRRRATARS